MDCVDNYKYLGCWVNEFGNDSKTVESLTSAAGRSFERMVGLFKQLGNMGYSTYCTLYETYVLPIVNYGAGVWGFDLFTAPQVLQNRIKRYYLGVHRYSANASTSMEMNILSIRYSRWLEVLRYFNRLMTLDDHRLPKF